MFSKDLSCQYLLIAALAFPVFDELNQCKEGEAFFEVLFYHITIF
jgi:hypothetical protein